VLEIKEKFMASNTRMFHCVVISCQRWY